MRTASVAGVALALLVCFAPLNAAFAAATETVLRDFKGGNDGANPAGGVIQDESGAVYGVTTNGDGTGCGGGGCGTAFEVSSSKVYTSLHHFAGGASDGAVPAAGLLLDPASGALYGVTTEGGSGTCGSDGLGCGTVFRLTPPAEGKTHWTETILHNFTGGCCSGDGGAPEGTLIEDANGALYGTTVGYGPNGGGTAFKLTPPTGGKTKWVLTTLYNFCAQPHCADGTNPHGALTLVSGNLYGTTTSGGATVGDNNGSGAVYELTPPLSGTGLWTESVLYSFEGFNVTPSDQANPYGRVVFDTKGNLYGCTTAGMGGVFELSPPVSAGPWTEKALHSFNNYSEGYGCIDLTFDNLGVLYGANPSSLADENGGTLFKLTPPSKVTMPWHFSVIRTFGPDAHNPNWFPRGSHPSASLIINPSSGMLYGTTSAGGALANQVGIVFSLGPNP